MFAQRLSRLRPILERSKSALRSSKLFWMTSSALVTAYTINHFNPSLIQIPETQCLDDHSLSLTKNKESSQFIESIKLIEIEAGIKRGNMFQLDLYSLDFMKKGSQFFWTFKYPDSGDTLDIIFIKDKEGEISAFRGNCPYEPEKKLKDSIVFGDKLVCPHHGCEFHIKSGFSEKYPTTDDLVPIPFEKKNITEKQNKRFWQSDSEEDIEVVFNDIHKDGIWIDAKDKKKYIKMNIKEAIKQAFGFESNLYQNLVDKVKKRKEKEELTKGSF